MSMQADLSFGTDSIALLKKKLSGFTTKEGYLKGLSYKPKSKDEVIIATAPKSGTTWMQQICHQIRSGPAGHMDFEEINQCVPFMELAFAVGEDLEAPQYGHDKDIPRVFKAHFWAEQCPTGCKRIVVLRDPCDVVVSYYNFLEDWFFEKGTVALEDFASKFWLAKGPPQSHTQAASYFLHLISWYEKRNDDDILILFFEDMKEDLEREVKKVAKFISTDKHDFTTPDIIKGAVERSSHSFMKEHESQFDAHITKLGRNEACGLPKSAGLGHGKVKSGECGNGKQVLSPSIHAAIGAKWKEIVEPVTGCSTYAELRKKGMSN